jgi:protein involved in polysaccharide export with SLBB domain
MAPRGNVRHPSLEDDMLPKRWPRFQFRLSSIFVLMLGIAIGFSLNVYTLRLLLGPGSEASMRSLPTCVIEPPDELSITVLGEKRVLGGKYLAGPDGNVNLNEYGLVYLAGRTIPEAEAAIRTAFEGLDTPLKVSVIVSDYRSKRYYIVTKDPVGGDLIQQALITCNDTVLEALAQVGGVYTPRATDIWISRPSTTGTGNARILPIDYQGAIEGKLGSNYQLLPGDRLFITKKGAAK